MFQDFKDLLSAFRAHSVKYLIVGGYAVSFHAHWAEFEFNVARRAE